MILVSLHMHTLKKSMCNNTSFDKGLQGIVINFSSLKNTQNYFNSSSKAGAYKWNSPTLTTLINNCILNNYSR